MSHFPVFAGQPQPRVQEGPLSAPTSNDGDAPTPEDESSSPARPAGSAAGSVAAGILASRVLGLVREKAVAYFFGVGPFLDVFQLALRGANLLNNLLGEGTLSASFIPVYSRLLEEGRERDAGRFAGAILGLLIAVAVVITGIGMVFAEPFVRYVLAPGFAGDAALVAQGTETVDRLPLAVRALRFALPMAACLALSAWALGVLKSHRRFFLPYVAPTLLNIAVITGLVVGSMTIFGDPFGGPDGILTADIDSLERLLMAAMVGALVGGVLQFTVQLPAVFRVLKGFRLSLSRRVEGVTEALQAFGPVLAGRGVAQVSSYVDTVLAGFAAQGTLGALRPALVLYMLPISLFGMSVAASELPELSRLGAEERAKFLDRVSDSTKQVLYLVVPTVVGYLLFGWFIVSALFGGGSFDGDDVWLVFLTLAGYTVGLGATATSRLLQNSFYALNEASVPARIAVLRVVISGVIGAGLMFTLDARTVGEWVDLEVPSRLSLAAVGLAAGASVGAWVELTALVWSLRSRLPGFGLPIGTIARMVLVAVGSAVPVAALLAWVPFFGTTVGSIGAIGLYASSYLGIGIALSFPEGRVWTDRFVRRIWRR
ncbi:MAG: murein biosynthesis integral membrane protein MurJ [Myxococcota bacterium]